MENNTKLKRIYCYVCLDSFYEKQELKKHFQNNHSGTNLTDGEVFMCKDCKMQFKTSRDLMNHLNNYGARIQKKMLLSRQKYMKNCKVCGMFFNTEHGLNKHIKTVHQKEYFCSVCFKGFKTQHILDLHSKFLHQSERSFKCAICAVSFNNDLDLWQHNLKIHKKSRTFMAKYMSKYKIIFKHEDIDLDEVDMTLDFLK